MKEILQALTENPTFYIATISPEGPRVRPFGFVMEYEQKLYFITSNDKDVFKQMKADSRVEICSTPKDGMNWMRLKGKVVFDSRKEVIKKALETAPVLAQIYQTPDNPSIEMFYITEGEATFYSFMDQPKTVKL
ncbi:MAG: pyridoxamine 5'-phosphate oxidase family protein [Methanimicrococcus sp.]|nr:pyridoxamine 5'-phosphate oxidase family protein [Methanimicrococcus sp.]MCL2141960.1 pyridoxamine 5'-phosphate oxidase family protein [Methanimicrococcus sp.]